MAIQTDHKNIIELIMGDLTQFHIPIYQRNYTWDAVKHVDKLVDDIIEFGDEYKDNKRAEYYIGNIIVKNQNRGMITERVVIDGQQRITTTILLLSAIRDTFNYKYSSTEGQATANSIHKSLYFEDGEEIKLKLNNMENQQTLTKILSAQFSSMSVADRETRYMKNYLHIQKRLSRMDQEYFENFLSLLRRVKVVIIFLDEDQDENSVFESINSLGKPLAGSDLIKNYLFTFKNYECDHNNESILTKLYTSTFESLFNDEKDKEEELESFFRSYIAVKTQFLVKKDPKAIYYGFKKFIGEIMSFEMCYDVVSDISEWALIYKILKTKGHPDIDLNHLGYLRTSFGVYVTLLMALVNKYSHIESNELIIDNRYELNRVFKSIVAYDVSRFIASYPEGELARFIPTVFNRLSNDERYSEYTEKFVELVTNTIEGYRQPSIETLKKSVTSIDLYSRKKQKLKKLLVLLENIGKKEILDYEKDLKKAQIEHIIPQTLAPGKWTFLTIEDHEKYLHTMGNLTLTFDNPTLSNMEFPEKKIVLHERSRILMNNKLIEYDSFGISEVEDRALFLLDALINEYFILNTL